MENSDLDAPQTPVIDRSTTGKRILFTLVFAVIGRLIEGVLAFVAVYQLLYTLITKRPPKAIVTRFANRLLGYAMEIGRYVPWNSPEKTFPSTIFRLSPMTSTQRQRHNHACQPAVPVRRGIVSQDRPFSDHQPVTVFVPYSRYVFFGGQQQQQRHARCRALGINALHRSHGVQYLNRGRPAPAGQSRSR